MYETLSPKFYVVKAVKKIPTECIGSLHVRADIIASGTKEAASKVRAASRAAKDITVNTSQAPCMNALAAPVSNSNALCVCCLITPVLR